MARLYAFTIGRSLIVKNVAVLYSANITNKKTNV